MFHPTNTINDPMRASGKDFVKQDGTLDTSYRYQTKAQSEGKVATQNVPDKVKYLLSNVKFAEH